MMENSRMRVFLYSPRNNLGVTRCFLPRHGDILTTTRVFSAHVLLTGCDSFWDGIVSFSDEKKAGARE